MERLAQIERAERHIGSLPREKRNLDDELERIRVSEMGAHSKVALLEARVDEREKETESLLKSNNEQSRELVQYCRPGVKFDTAILHPVCPHPLLHRWCYLSLIISVSSLPHSLSSRQQQWQRR